MRLRIFGSGLALLSTVALSSVFPTSAHALFNGAYDINPVNFAAACSPDCGNVTITGDGTTSITVDVLVTGTNMQLHGIDKAVVYLNLATAPTQPPAAVTFDAVTNGTVWSLLLDLPPNGGSYGDANVGIACDSPIPGNPCGTHVKFTLTNTSAMFLALNDKGNFLQLRLTTTDDEGQGVRPTGFGTLTLQPQPVPGPIVGTGVPGAVIACGALLAWARRRKYRLAA